MTWTFRVCDHDGTDLEEIVNAAARSVTVPLNGGRVASFTVRLDSAQAARVLALDGELLKVYRGSSLMFVGPMVTAEESSEEGGGTVAVTAADPFWRLLKRVFGRSVDGAGRGVGYGEGTAVSPVNKSTIAQHIVEATLGDGDHGVRIGTIVASSTAWVGPWYFKIAGEAIQEMGATLDGYDWELVPSEPTTDASGTKLATFNVYASKSTDRTAGQVGAVIFEYGCGKFNVRAYKRARTLDGLCNQAFSLPQGFPDGHPAGQVPIQNQIDASGSITKHGLMQAVVSDDLTVDDFRRQLADEHVRIRKQAREIITFEPTVNSEYDYGTEFVEGDLVTARAVVNGVSRFDVAVRVYGAQFDIDAEGNETMTLTLIPE